MKSKQITKKEIETDEEYIPDIEIEIDDFNNFNVEILEEINFAREFPEEYIVKLENILKSIGNDNHDNYLFSETVPFIYKDLYDSLNDSIKFLKSQKKLSPLIYDPSISYSCEDLLFEYVNDQNYKNSNLAFEKRLKNYGQSFGDSYEIINYDMFDPEFIVINLILSDGDKNRFERNVIFNPNLKYIGINSGILPPNQVCVIINCCEDFYPKDEKVPDDIINKFKTKKNNFNSKTIPNRKSKYKKGPFNKIWDKEKNKNIKKTNIKSDDNNNILRNKNNINRNMNEDKNVILRGPQNKKNKKDIFYYDLENFDEEEFFEKEFDTSYGKYEKEKNSTKRMFSTTTNDENGVRRTIVTTIYENVDGKGIKRGYYIEKENVSNIDKKERENQRTEKEKKDLKILKDMEKKEIERIQNDKNRKRIKEIPIKLKDKNGEFDERENYIDEENGTEQLPEGAVKTQVEEKTIIDSNGKPTVQIIKTITYEDGSIQKIIDKQPLERH